MKNTDHCGCNPFPPKKDEASTHEKSEILSDRKYSLKDATMSLSPTQTEQWISDNIYWVSKDELALAIKKRKADCDESPSSIGEDYDGLKPRMLFSMNICKQKDCQHRTEASHNGRTFNRAKPNGRPQISCRQYEDLNYEPQKVRQKRSSYSRAHDHRECIQSWKRGNNRSNLGRRIGLSACDTDSEYQADDETSSAIESDIESLQNKSFTLGENKSSGVVKIPDQMTSNHLGVLSNNSAVERPKDPWRNDPWTVKQYRRKIDESIEDRNTSMNIKTELNELPKCRYSREKVPRRSQASVIGKGVIDVGQSTISFFDAPLSTINKLPATSKSHKKNNSKRETKSHTRIVDKKPYTQNTERKTTQKGYTRHVANQAYKQDTLTDITIEHERFETSFEEEISMPETERMHEQESCAYRFSIPDRKEQQAYSKPDEDDIYKHYEESMLDERSYVSYQRNGFGMQDADKMAEQEKEVRTDEDDILMRYEEQMEKQKQEYNLQKTEKTPSEDRTAKYNESKTTRSNYSNKVSEKTPPLVPALCNGKLCLQNEQGQTCEATRASDQNTVCHAYHADIMQKLSDILDTFKEELHECKTSLPVSLSRQVESCLKQRESYKQLLRSSQRRACGTQTLTMPDTVTETDVTELIETQASSLRVANEESKEHYNKFTQKLCDNGISSKEKSYERKEKSSEKKRRDKEKKSNERAVEVHSSPSSEERRKQHTPRKSSKEKRLNQEKKKQKPLISASSSPVISSTKERRSSKKGKQSHKKAKKEKKKDDTSSSTSTTPRGKKRKSRKSDLKKETNRRKQRESSSSVQASSDSDTQSTYVMKNRKYKEEKKLVIRADERRSKEKKRDGEHGSAISLKAEKGFTESLAQILKQVSKSAATDDLKTANILLNLGKRDKSPGSARHSEGELQPEVINVNLFVAVPEQPDTEEDTITSPQSESHKKKSSSDKKSTMNSEAKLNNKSEVHRETDHTVRAEHGKAPPAYEAPTSSSKPKSSKFNVAAESHEDAKTVSIPAAMLGVECDSHIYTPSLEERPVPQLKKIDVKNSPTTQQSNAAAAAEATLCCFVKRETAASFYPNCHSLGDVILFS